jgi:hypothetical protein
LIEYVKSVNSYRLEVKVVYRDKDRELNSSVQMFQNCAGNKGSEKIWLWKIGKLAKFDTKNWKIIGIWRKILDRNVKINKFDVALENYRN